MTDEADRYMDDAGQPLHNRLGVNSHRLGRKLPRRAMEAKHFKKKRKQRSTINRRARKHDRETND